MRTSFRYIIVAFLLAGYTSGAHAALLRLTAVPATASGPEVLGEAKGEGNIPRHPQLTQRRHLPMVTQLCISPAEPAQPIKPETLLGEFAWGPRPIPVDQPLDYFSTRCNKAPPTR